jgi:hypothetical protein
MIEYVRQIDEMSEILVARLTVIVPQTNENVIEIETRANCSADEKSLHRNLPLQTSI